MAPAKGNRRRLGSEVQLALIPDGSGDSERSDPALLTRDDIEVDLGITPAETWPARYKFHKYWGRKPANVVTRYIEFFSRPGETVLDPFLGSGVTVVEGARLGRRAVGFDLNPFAARLSAAMLKPPALATFEAAAKAVMRRAEALASERYVTRCDVCRSQATLRSVAYEGDEAVEVRFWCETCRASSARPPSGEDLRLAAERVPAPASAPDADVLFGWEMRKLERRGIRRWRDLFTSRNFATAAHLRDAVLSVEDAASREWLLLSLTASLAQFTKMIADFAGDAGGPSWKINCYWLPRRWQELNPLWYFENRVSKSLDAIKDLVSCGAPFKRGKVTVADSRRLRLRDASVDYVFTDPPYGGEGIQYGELSLLWCLWLGESEDLSSEIAFNPCRKLDQDHYASALKRVFAECYRVLKPGRWMTVTFANKDPVVWDSLMDACREAGFVLVTAAPMKRSAPSLTETTMHTAPKADLVLNFQKPPTNASVRRVADVAETYSLEAAVRRISNALLEEGKDLDVHAVFDRVTVDWFSWFYENGVRPRAVQPTLAHVEAAMRELRPTPRRRTSSEA